MTTDMIELPGGLPTDMEWANGFDRHHLFKVTDSRGSRWLLDSWDAYGHQRTCGEIPQVAAYVIQQLFMVAKDRLLLPPLLEGRDHSPGKRRWDAAVATLQVSS